MTLKELINPFNATGANMLQFLMLNENNGIESINLNYHLIIFHQVIALVGAVSFDIVNLTFMGSMGM